MKCQAIYAWLLVTRPEEALPPAVELHLLTCRVCGQRRHRLAALPNKTRQPVPLPAADDTLKARLLARLEEVPSPPRPAARHRPVQRRSRAQVPRRWLVAVLVLFAVGIVGWLAAAGPGSGDQREEGSKDRLAKRRGPGCSEWPRRSDPPPREVGSGAAEPRPLNEGHDAEMPPRFEQGKPAEKVVPGPDRSPPAGLPDWHGKPVQGVVRAVDPVARTVRLTVKERGRDLTVTYAVAPTARILYHEREGLLGDLEPDSRVHARLLDARTIGEIRRQH